MRVRFGLQRHRTVYCAKCHHHWQTMMATPDVDALARKLRTAGVRFVSPGVVVMEKEKAGFAKGMVVSDPDGHDLLLIQK